MRSRGERFLRQQKDQETQSDVKGKTADIRELQEIIRQQSELAVLNITLD